MKKYLIITVCILLNHFAEAQIQSLQWAASFKGDTSYSNECRKVITDLSGNVFTTGYFDVATDFDPGSGEYILTPDSNHLFLNQTFISKIDGNGNFEWAHFLVGAIIEAALDPDQNVIVTGEFCCDSVDFDPGVGTHFLNADAGNNAVFILKLDNDGNFISVKKLSGESFTRISSIAFDEVANMYATGFFTGTTNFDLNGGINILSTVPSVTQNIFVAKWDMDGNSIWAKQIKSSNDYVDEAEGLKLKLDVNNDVVISGIFSDVSDFDPGLAEVYLTPSVFVDQLDIFILKLNSDGDFIYVKQFGSGGAEELGSMDLDGNGNIYIAGGYMVPFDANPGDAEFMLPYESNGDAYIIKINSAGNFEWAKTLNGFDAEFYTTLKVLVNNDVVFGGVFTNATDFNSDPLQTYILNSTTQDMFVQELHSNGDFLWATKIGGNSLDKLNSLTVDDQNNLIICGYFTDTVDFDSNDGSYELVGTFRDAFAAKYAINISGIFEINNPNPLQIYPNPTDGILNISNLNEKNQTAILRIYNSIGILVLEQKYFSRITLDIKSLTDGIYFVTTADLEGKISQNKLVKISSNNE